eukprot:gnl/Ergobibamus_cyprinoides/335.p1 GENE.gnl/Ergobibamus_cyprinoides/335~~gnl/Ergobibamus_cyprinoides/335.p1  ORF type:complete len:426 (+),score=124.54 gnl/Ergobibamus_cyprinoides/335:1737-3014(+)
MADVTSTHDERQVEATIDPEVLALSDAALNQRIQLIQAETRMLQSEISRMQHEIRSMRSDVAQNAARVQMSKQLPYLVSNVSELVDLPAEEDQDAQQNVDAATEKTVVVRTTTRQSMFLPVAGLVERSDLHPGDAVGVNKDSYLILEALPTEYDGRVSAMEVSDKPTEDYTDIGGLAKQIEELKEAVVLPMTNPEIFKSVGVKPPKGVLLHGPPGTGKTLLARACAAQTNATFLKIGAPQLVQMYIGEGSRLIRDAFALAKKKAPAIIFIDELDAIGTKRFDSDQSGDREVARTMLELLNQLDGFGSDDKVKVIAATNRPDILDPALLRSGRFDRKIELPHPSESARVQILKIHSRKMTVSPTTNYEELARSTSDFNGAQLKAVCVEAGMRALRRAATEVGHEDFVEGIGRVLSKRTTERLGYYA